MELYIYNRNLELQGIIDNYTSLQWIRRYSSAGEFELHCPLDADTVNLLQKENLICKNDDDKEAGVITYISMSDDGESGSVIVVKGSFLTGYLKRRIIWGTENFNNTVETAMRVLVSNNCITPQNTDRKINNLQLGNFGNYPETVDYQVSYANLADEVESLAVSADLGQYIEFDKENNKLLYTVYRGLDRSVNQSVNPRAIFAQEYDNVLSQNYVTATGDYKNVCLIGGIGEGSERKTAAIGDATGLDRFEVFCDQNNLSNVVEEKTVDGKTAEEIASSEDIRIASAQSAYDILAAELEANKAALKINQINAKIKADEMVEFMTGKFNVNLDDYPEFLEIQAEQDALYHEWFYLWYRTYGNSQLMHIFPSQFHGWSGDDPRFDWSKIGWDAETETLTLYEGVQYLAGKAQNNLENTKNFVAAEAEVAVTGSNVMTDEEYTALLIEKGNETLAANKEVLTFDGSINPRSNLEYRVDYNLGDVVTQINRDWGIELDARITEITEIYEESGLELNIVFGNAVPTLIKKIKNIAKG